MRSGLRTILFQSVKKNSVRPDGWSIDLVVRGQGLKTGGTWQLSPDSAQRLSISVTSPGFDDNGNAITVQRTVYGTVCVFQPYPNSAVFDNSTAAGGQVFIARVSLSDYIYYADTTALLTLGSAWYVDPVLGNAVAATFAIGNRSRVPYPTVIGQWATVPLQKITTSLVVEAFAIQRFGQSGRPVRCVKFIKSDGVTPVSDVQTALAKSAADNCPLYATTVTASDYASLASVTVDFVAYPWIGDANSVLDTRVADATNYPQKPGTLSFVADKNNVWSEVAWVDNVSGNDGTGVINDSAHPFATLDKAVRAISLSRSTGSGGAIKYIDGAACYLKNAGAQYTDTPLNTVDPTLWTGFTPPSRAQLIQRAWFTVTRDPAALIGDITVQGRATQKFFWGNYVKWSGLTYDGVTNGRNYPWAAASLSGSLAWEDGMVLTGANADASGTLWDLASTSKYRTNLTRSGTNVGIFGRMIRNCTDDMALLAQACFQSTVRRRSGQDFMCGSKANPVNNSRYTVYLNCAFYKHLDGTEIFSPFNVAAGTPSPMSHIALVNVLWERMNNQVTPLLSINETVAVNCENIVFAHCTFVGSRTNLWYNQFSTDCYRRNISMRYCFSEWFPMKQDEFIHDGTFISGWQTKYGVGFEGTVSAQINSNFHYAFDGLLCVDNAYDGSTAFFTSDKSCGTGSDGTKTGNGDYTPNAAYVSNPLYNRVPAGHQMVPWDISGASRLTDGTGAAGAFERIA